MKTALFYDFETDGLIEFKKPSNDPVQPHITQMAAVLATDDGKVKAILSTLIKPDGWETPQVTIDLNGITTEICDEWGIPLKTAYSAFMAMWRKADFRVAHNQPFDARILRIAQHRLEVKETAMDAWKNGPSVCTMSIGAMYVKRVHPDRPEARIKLSRLYEFLFSVTPKEQHQALADCKTMMRCYFKLLEEGVKVHAK